MLPYRRNIVLSDLVPLDLVGGQIQLEAGAVALVDRGALGNVGVVDHAVLAVGDEGVNLDVIVGGEPLAERVLSVGSPQDRPIQHTAVFKGIRKAGDINAAAAAKALTAI